MEAHEPRGEVRCVSRPAGDAASFCAPRAACACGLRLKRTGQVLTVVLDDVAGGLGAAASAALAAHLPLRQVALPDGSVAARLPLRALPGDDVQLRAALAGWNAPAGWLRAPVARLLLVGSVSQQELAARVVPALTAAVEAAEATRTAWAVLHVVRAPNRDDEAPLGDALRARFPADKVARVALAPDGRLASAAALDARLGDCLRDALSWRADAFRAELERLAHEQAELPCGAERAAEVADGLAALLEAARWHAPALAACDAFAALLEPPCPRFATLPLGGSSIGDGTPRVLADAADAASDAPPCRFELRQRCFARAARLLRWGGLYEELGERGLMFVRSVAAELAAGTDAQPSASAADLSHPRCVMHLWASGACLQLVGVLKAAASTLQLDDVARTRLLARLQGSLYSLALTHIRAMSTRLVTGRSEAASGLFEELGELADVEPLQLLQSSFATDVSCETLCLQLSFAASSALLAGGRLRSAAKLNLAAGLALLERGAVHRGCSLLVPCCQALLAEGWRSVLAAPLSALMDAAAAAGNTGARTNAALMLLSLPADAVSAPARAAALEAVGGTRNMEAEPVDCSDFICLAQPRGAQPLRVSRDADDDAAPLVVELHSAAPLAMELRNPVLLLVDLQRPKRSVACTGPLTCVLAPGMQQVAFAVPLRAAPGEYALSALSARLRDAYLIVQPRRWSPRSSCSSEPARWPPMAASAAGSSGALALVVAEAREKHPSVQLVLPYGSLILGTTSPQLVGLCVASSRPLRMASLSITGGLDLDIPRAQTVLVRTRDSDAAAPGSAWQRVAMADGVIALPDAPAEGVVIVWLCVHLRLQTTLRAVDQLDGAGGDESAMLRIDTELRQPSASGMLTSASTLAVRAGAAFGVSSSTKHLPGAGGTAALQARMVLQTPAPTRVRSVVLRPHQSGSNAACGRAQCDCKRTHTASSLLSLPASLQSGGELATLFLLRPCSSMPFAFLNVDFECDASPHAAGDWPAAEAPTLHSCSVLVRLPDVPPLRVSRFAASLGRVGETLRIRWDVHRLDAGPDDEDAGASSPPLMDASSAATELQSAASLPSASSAPAYEADDERDDATHVASSGRISESSQFIWQLRAELQAPASRWLVLSSRESSLALRSGEACTIVAECVPVVAGELETPTLLLRWRGSGATVRGVWEDPPAAATVQVLPACV